eukprot:CAMPEP_0197823502 /NCGR_PEP_ID=MMETSP1437-20131217/851_1 /TAXON_ID=49252 ORGANISM="Eucampia antarctica, Strain CCMP1452" /NCGR_SAMPLE_ID=MMETSP1437 /ASSEMBLY_ACC=CAM_ASM_001096 /LENGTH=414 /DNA_ID=CAMNT_0043422717 /DNA_START=82 /DNA_END=1326 /DNA_ORIENTATION=-
MTRATSTKYLIIFVLYHFTLIELCFKVFSETEVPSYGADISWPIHSSNVSTNYPWLPHNVDPTNNPVPSDYEGMPVQHFGDIQSKFERYIQGCRDYYDEESDDLCDTNEEGRLQMNLEQPRSMVNFTDVGYKKIRAPDNVFKILKDFWEKNQGKEYEENWFEGNVGANYWEVPTYMLSVENEELVGGGQELKDTVWNLAEKLIREWTDMNLSSTSLYGIRIYKEGSILSSHVDRLPLISSAIINVAQDVDEDWPIEVIGHDGIAHNITMEPGDMILYESHSIIHGRPFALKGRYYANIFIHFEPVEDFVSDGRNDESEETPFYIVPGSDGINYMESDDDSSDDSEYIASEEEYDSRDSEETISEDEEYFDSQDQGEDESEKEELIEYEEMDSEDEEMDSEDNEIVGPPAATDEL